jgi:hypothetical protein
MIHIFAGALGATLGATVCIASMVREKDDVINVWIAAASTGAVAALKSLFCFPIFKLS